MSRDGVALRFVKCRAQFVGKAVNGQKTDIVKGVEVLFLGIAESYYKIHYFSVGNG